MSTGSKMQLSLIVRGQHPPGDIAGHFRDDMELVKRAEAVGFDGIVKGSHYSTHPFQSVQQVPFLAYAAALVRERGGVIAAVDVTIVCERPKIAPHRDRMIERVAEILEISPGRVSVKATTTENLGFTGRGEGIAAQAVATVRLPF